MSGKSKKGGGGPGKKLPAPIPRLQQVEEWLGTGLRPRDVINLATTTFGISSRTAERDMNKVYAKWAKEDEGSRDARRERHGAELWDLYHQARKYCEPREVTRVTKDGREVTYTEEPRPKDFLDTARILERLAKLYGLDAPEKLEVQGFSPVAEAVLAMTPQERERRIAELVAKRQEAIKPSGPKGGAR